MLNNQETANVIYQASLLLEEKEWCQGVMAHHKSGRLVTRPDHDLYGDSNDLTHICMEAAIYMTMGKFAYPEARQVVGLYLRKKGKCMFEANDEANTKQEVLDEMRRFSLSLLEEVAS